MADEQAWRDGLKVGDVVVVGGRQWTPYVAEVCRATKAQIQTSSYRFLRKGGGEVGRGSSYREQVMAHYIIRPTPEQVAAHKAAVADERARAAAREAKREDHRAAIREFVECNSVDCPIGDLERVVAALPTAKTTER